MCDTNQIPRSLALKSLSIHTTLDLQHIHLQRLKAFNQPSACSQGRHSWRRTACLWPCNYGNTVSPHAPCGGQPTRWAGTATRASLTRLGQSSCWQRGAGLRPRHRGRPLRAAGPAATRRCPAYPAGWRPQWRRSWWCGSRALARRCSGPSRGRLRPPIPLLAAGTQAATAPGAAVAGPPRAAGPKGSRRGRGRRGPGRRRTRGRTCRIRRRAVCMLVRHAQGLVPKGTAPRNKSALRFDSARRRRRPRPRPRPRYCR